MRCYVWGMPRQQELRRQLLAGGATAALALAVLFGPRVYRALADLWNGFAAEPTHKVHAELLPQWALSVSNTPGMPGEAEAFDALKQGLDESRTDELQGIADALRDALRDPTVESAAPMIELLTDWNAALDREGAPYVVRGGVLRVGTRIQPFITGAHTLHDMPVAVGDASVRLRVIERIDGTNIRESVLGETHEVAEGALVLSDRVLEFALNRVWPLLDADAKAPRWGTTFAEDVREEVKRDLSPEAFEALRATAAKRQAAVEAVEAIQSRTHCSNFVMKPLGWAGASGRSLKNLDRFTNGGPCPGVLPLEYEAIRDFGTQAKGTKQLDEAVQALLAWSMRPIAMHEARHAADSAITGGVLDPVPCSACGDLSDRARIELSAYTAEFAWTDTPAMAAFQACLAVGQRRGSHRTAVEYLFEQVDGDCIFGLPEQSEIRAFAKRAFDRDAPIALPDTFPASVTLPPRSQGASRGRG